MPSTAQLMAEAAYRDEVVPPALAEMGRTVRTALALPAGAIGFKGNELHLNGAHRSRRWILTSDWCTDRSYTVSYPDDRLGDENWIAGFDISAPQHILLPMCQRLDVAVRAGQLEELAAWYGNLGGDNRVDGYNNILNRLASSDSSHLTHLHGTVLRRHANNRPFMLRLAAVLIGDTDMLKDEALSWPAETLVTGETVPANGEPVERFDAATAVAGTLRHSFAGRRAAEAALAEVKALKLAPVDVDAVADAVAARLGPALEAAAEAAVRRVLGAVDGATPQG